MLSEMIRICIDHMFCCLLSIVWLFGISGSHGSGGFLVDTVYSVTTRQLFISGSSSIEGLH
ncbi:hypothetical protein BJX96DRAFT_152827 [Aspergillus floccosus]